MPPHKQFVHSDDISQQKISRVCYVALKGVQYNSRCQFGSALFRVIEYVVSLLPGWVKHKLFIVSCVSRLFL